MKWLASINSEFGSHFEYISRLIEVLTDKQNYEYKTRVQFLSYYFSNPGIPEAIRDFIHFLMTQKFEGEDKDKIDKSLIDFQLAREIIKKTADIFQLAIILFKDDKNYEKIAFNDFQLPLVYLHLKNSTELIILYSNEMIIVEDERSDIETILPKLIYEKQNEEKVFSDVSTGLFSPFIKEEVKNEKQGGFSKEFMQQVKIPEDKRGPFNNPEPPSKQLQYMNHPSNFPSAKPNPDLLNRDSTDQSTLDYPQKIQISSLNSSTNPYLEKSNIPSTGVSPVLGAGPVPIPKHSGPMNIPVHYRNPSDQNPSPAAFVENKHAFPIPRPVNNFYQALPAPNNKLLNIPQPQAYLPNQPIESKPLIPKVSKLLPESNIPTHVPIPKSHILPLELLKEPNPQVFAKPIKEQPIRVPDEIIKFINHTSNIIVNYKIFDEKLQNYIKNITSTYPEIGQVACSLICSVKSPSRIAVPQNSDELRNLTFFKPVKLNEQEKPQMNKNEKKCESCAKVMQDDNFSLFECQNCSNICNYCRVRNCEICIRCGRSYEEFEKEILIIMKDSMDNGSFNEEVKKQVHEKTIRAVKRFKKCFLHGGLVEKEMISNEISCPENCFVCNQCRIKDTEKCVVCNHPYSQTDSSFILSLKLSLENS